MSGPFPRRSPVTPCAGSWKLGAASVCKSPGAAPARRRRSSKRPPIAVSQEGHMATEDSLTRFTSNGVAHSEDVLLETPAIAPDLMAQLIAKADMMWRETMRRDGNAVWHSWQWMRAFYAVLGL